MEREQAGAGRDGRTRFARPNFQARTGTEKYSFDHEQDWQPYPVDVQYTLFICNDHTFSKLKSSLVKRLSQVPVSCPYFGFEINGLVGPHQRMYVGAENRKYHT